MLKILPKSWHVRKNIPPPYTNGTTRSEQLQISVVSWKLLDCASHEASRAGNVCLRSWGIACHSCCRMWNMWSRSTAVGWLTPAHQPGCPRDAQLEWDEVNVLASPCWYPAVAVRKCWRHGLCVWRALLHWRTSPCPMACKAGSAPGWITSSLKP